MLKVYIVDKSNNISRVNGFKHLRHAAMMISAVYQYVLNSQRTNVAMQFTYQTAADPFDHQTHL